jgi:hypothetical protein
MRRSRWVKMFCWAMIGGILAPAALASVLISRVARGRLLRILRVVRDGASDIRDDMLGEFTLEEFLTGIPAKRPRR